MAPFRTKETEEQYRIHRTKHGSESSCPLCAANPLEQFEYWKIIENRSPYDVIAKIHHMIVPVRHVDEADLTKEEHKELFQLKHGFVNNHYRFIIEATIQAKTIPGHFHLHLIVPK